MYLSGLNILDYKNIRQADLTFARKINCLVGRNGMGKTNVLDAVYYLSFCKSAFNTVDSQNIRHEAEFSLIQGTYAGMPDEDLQITCGLKRGVKKQFRRNKKDYKRLLDHIGLLPLVMVSPKDTELVSEGSDERRRFVDSVISQYDKTYLQHLLDYNALLKQRNSLLKQIGDDVADRQQALASYADLLDVLEMQLASHAGYIYKERTAFTETFVPLFRTLYDYIAECRETVSLRYRSQLQERNLQEAFLRTRERDVILGWTSQGIHKDELEMYLGDWPLRRVGSQGQQKTYLIALKLAQAEFLSLRAAAAGQQTLTPGIKPILLLDDIFDKLDADRVERIVELVNSDRFGQIFITDTDRQHLVELLRPIRETSRVFMVDNGNIVPYEEY